MNAVLKIEAINLTALRIHVQQQVATAKLAEFENQAYSMGQFIGSGLLDRAAAADILLSVAESNGLVREQGDDIIQAIMAEALGSGVTC